MKLQGRFPLAYPAIVLILLAGLAVMDVQPVRAENTKDVEKRLANSIEVLSEIINIPEGGIPNSLLRKCQGLVIVPHLIKGGFIVGGQHGKGIVVHRLPGGRWSAPGFVDITGGSIGFQIGGEATDLVMVVNSEKGFQALLSSNFKFGANASAAAGPVGRDAAAGTDAKLSADIFTYSRSKGAFAGVSLEGAGCSTDDSANKAFYGRDIDEKVLLNKTTKPYPAQAQRLLELLKPYTVIKKK